MSENLFNAVPLTGKPVLGAFVFADTATQLEGMSDTQIVQMLMGMLRQWFGPQGVQVPEPVDFQRSRWAADPFAFGSYSSISPGATEADYMFMGQPVPYSANLPASANRLFFAGEATDPAHPSSAWGAYDSG